MTANVHGRGGPGGWPGHGRSFVLPLVIGAIQLTGTHFAGKDQPAAESLDALGALLLVAGPAALLLRRRYPATVLGAALAATFVYRLLDYPEGPIFLALIVAFVNAILAGRRVAAFATMIVGYTALQWIEPFLGHEDAPSAAEALGVAAWLLVVATVAEVVRTRRERFAEVTRAREEEARRRASEERLRVARELHDVLAHNISLINVQAGVALHLIDEQPEQARSALSAIKNVSNEVLNELRSVLDILRGSSEEPPLSPAPGLAQLDGLVTRNEAAGLHVRTEVKGAPRSLPAGVDLAAFRIVQEALTNVTRHAGPASAVVRVRYGDEDLTVEVEDDGRGLPGKPSAGGGRGIAGMRERAAALGGDLTAAPRTEGGWRVRARLPLSASGSEVAH
jgi:signal transduction histidine kinase